MKMLTDVSEEIVHSKSLCKFIFEDVYELFQVDWGVELEQQKQSKLKNFSNAEFLEVSSVDL